MIPPTELEMIQLTAAVLGQIALSFALPIIVTASLLFLTRNH